MALIGGIFNVVNEWSEMDQWHKMTERDARPQLDPIESLF